MKDKKAKKSSKVICWKQIFLVLFAIVIFVSCIISFETKLTKVVKTTTNQFANIRDNLIDVVNLVKNLQDKIYILDKKVEKQNKKINQQNKKIKYMEQQIHLLKQTIEGGNYEKQK